MNAPKTIEECLVSAKAEEAHKATHPNALTECDDCFKYYTLITNSLFIDLIERLLAVEKA